MDTGKGFPSRIIEAMSYGLPWVATPDGRRAGTCHPERDAGSSGPILPLWGRRSESFAGSPPARARWRGRAEAGPGSIRLEAIVSELIHEFTSSAAPSLQAARGQYAWQLKITGGSKSCLQSCAGLLLLFAVAGSFYLGGRYVASFPAALRSSLYRFRARAVLVGLVIFSSQQALYMEASRLAASRWRFAGFV